MASLSSSGSTRPGNASPSRPRRRASLYAFSASSKPAVS
eukprot:CAMPEP_0184498034 /NCGR_PEP_ID=MMETSP0113_2-20130426/38010_1 /TAXON_ID=91329 /ORGANISM="Norrisiella sphaerica, Strain BC52" /LENGTH=38 /DNA_ID= /DNA_START= /DNA_END= /DNA_ORIENTATION=